MGTHQDIEPYIFKTLDYFLPLFRPVSCIFKKPSVFVKPVFPLGILRETDEKPSYYVLFSHFMTSPVRSSRLIGHNYA